MLLTKLSKFLYFFAVIIFLHKFYLESFVQTFSSNFEINIDFITSLFLGSLFEIKLSSFATLKKL